MSFLLHSRPVGLGLSLGAAFTTYSLLTPRRQLYALCDAAPSSTFNSFSSNASTPVTSRRGYRRGGLNPKAVRQISSGSIAGVLGGLAVSVFSKPLTLLIGLLIIGVQFAESQLGISLIPYNRMQRYVNSVDLRSLVQENVAFKLAFGATFALTGFAQL